MTEVSTFRLYLLRAMYVFMFVGLAIFKLPGIFNPSENVSTTGSVVLSVLGAIALLAVLGIRYPCLKGRRVFNARDNERPWPVRDGNPSCCAALCAQNRERPLCLTPFDRLV